METSVDLKKNSNEIVLPVSISLEAPSKEGPKMILWAFIFLVFLSVYNGLVGITGLIKMMVVTISSSAGIKTHVGISILIFFPMIISSFIYALIVFGPLNQFRKIVLYTAVVIIATCTFILWLMTIFTQGDFSHQFIFSHIVGSIYVPLFYSLMAFYDDSELAKLVFPFPCDK